MFNFIAILGEVELAMFSPPRVKYEKRSPSPRNPPTFTGEKANTVRSDPPCSRDFGIYEIIVHGSRVRYQQRFLEKRLPHE